MIIETRNYKGGTGKSTVLKFIIDNCRDTGKPLTVLDTDCGNNADIARSHKQLIGEDFKLINFKVKCAEDYIRFFKEIKAAHDEGRTLIINNGAANQDETEAFGKGLEKVCSKNGIDYRTMWVVDADAYCANQVEHFLDATKRYPKVTIIKNLGLGSTSAFEGVVPSKYPQIFFPEFHDIFTKYLKGDKNLPVSSLEYAMDFAEWCLFEDAVEQGKEAAKQAVEMARQMPKD